MTCPAFKCQTSFSLQLLFSLFLAFYFFHTHLTYSFFDPISDEIHSGGSSISDEIHSEGMSHRSQVVITVASNYSQINSLNPILDAHNFTSHAFRWTYMHSPLMTS